MAEFYHQNQKTATVSFKTVGCRLNQAETAIMRASFETAGFAVVPFGHACDVCVVHGCAVTAAAERDSLRLARTARRMNPDVFVVLTGCAADIGGEAARAICGADIEVRQNDKFKLPKILRRHGLYPMPAESTMLLEKNKNRPAPLPRFETTRGIVKIQDGCDFFCSYCVVPHARGRTKSRPAGEIIDEAAGLGKAGYREIVLTGANIGCYNHNGKKLTHLLELLEALPVIDRIRISSIEISTIERDIIDFMSQSRKLCRFLHLPLQSGDDRILRAMGRRYTAREYRELVEYASEQLGEFGLGTDALIGFPGEDERAFAATEKLIMELPFNNLHVFAYSRRPGTRAESMTDNVPDTIKKQRTARLAALGRRKRAVFAKTMIGRKMSVLIESVDANGHAAGWTGEYLKARISGTGLRPNRIVGFVPDHVEGETLCGRACKSG